MSAEERNLVNQGSASAPHTESPAADGKAVARPTTGSGPAGAGGPRQSPAGGSGRDCHLDPGTRSLLRAPSIWKILNTVSTDDAYVNGHVTFVAARVPGQVTTVYVDDNDRVRKGSIARPTRQGAVPNPGRLEKSRVGDGGSPVAGDTGLGPRPRCPGAGKPVQAPARH